MPFAVNTVNYDEPLAIWTSWNNWLKIPNPSTTSCCQRHSQPGLGLCCLSYQSVRPSLRYTPNAARGSIYANQHSTSTKDLARDVQEAFQTDMDLKNRHQSTLGGKWNHFMNQTHLGYKSWQQPAHVPTPRMKSVRRTAAGRYGKHGYCGSGELELLSCGVDTNIGDGGTVHD